MSRRHGSFAFWFLAAVVTTGTLAWEGAFGAVRWTKVPSITVVAEAGDSRSEAVREAVAYWNRTFAELGTPFRLGDVTSVTGSVSTIPASLEKYPGDVVIVLSNAQFISYTARRGDRVVIAIKNGNTAPLALPNVLRNVIAHELGHGVGLGHNSDPELLMCGRPASCRPDAFQSATSRIFPLSDEERSRLLALYPRNWPIRARE